MNRLKFRIWDNHTERYVTFVYETNKDYYLFIGRSGYVTAFNCYGEEIDFEDGRFVVQQYTGLQDRDGKDIYEGDILEYTYNVGCFKFSNGKLLRGCIPSNENIQEKINQQVKWQGAQFIGIHPIIKIGYTLVDKKPQVIGNIFENPELIKTNE